MFLGLLYLIWHRASSHKLSVQDLEAGALRTWAPKSKFQCSIRYLEWSSLCPASKQIPLASVSVSPKNTFTLFPYAHRQLIGPDTDQSGLVARLGHVQRGERWNKKTESPSKADMREFMGLPPTLLEDWSRKAGSWLSDSSSLHGTS
jgi:hypothetical protein